MWNELDTWRWRKARVCTRDRHIEVKSVGPRGQYEARLSFMSRVGTFVRPFAGVLGGAGVLPSTGRITSPADACTRKTS